MSKYTTGELAKLCGVSVRTVQYYDSRGILLPSELSEGGRRLYSDGDLRRLKIICFLREAGMPINSIGKLLDEPDSESVIELLLIQQEQLLRKELQERRDRLETLAGLRRELKKAREFSVESIGDIAIVMSNRKKLFKLRGVVLALGILMDIIEAGTIVLWCVSGIWLPFAAGMCVVAGLAVWISRLYWKHTAYICPQCHETFKPQFKERFWAPHTPRACRLTCPHCGRRGMCVEIYAEEQEQAM